MINGAVKIKEFRSGLSKTEVLDFDKNKLQFVLEESRLYAGKVLENVVRISNKSFILLGIVGSILVFIINWAFASEHLALLMKHLYLMFLPLLVYVGLLLYSFVTLIRIFLAPADYYPPGFSLQEDKTKNVLREISNCSLNELIHNQLENYETKNTENLIQINYIAGCLKWHIFLVFAPVVIYSIGCLILCIFGLI